MEIGLFFGSFNPVHIGHLIIGQHMLEEAGLDEVWMVLSPQNPFKSTSSLAPQEHRMQMLRRAVWGNKRIKASTIELNLPKPSYTINTLNVLKDKYPDYRFVLIMGEDNLAKLNKWKSIKEILRRHEIFVYRRSISPPHQYQGHDRIRFFNFPTLDISSTYIRNRIARGKSVQYLVPPRVFKYLSKYRLYEKKL